MDVSLAFDAGEFTEPPAHLWPGYHWPLNDHLDGGALYFLTNEVDAPVSVRVRFAEKPPAVLCETEDGQLYSLETSPVGDGCTINMEFAPWGARALLFGQAGHRPLPKFTPDGRTIELSGGWTLAATSRYRIGESDVEIDDLPPAPKPAPLGDWRSLLGDHFSGEAQYTVEFDCPAELVAQPARIEMGKVRCAAEVFINDKSIGRRVWPPFALDSDGSLRSGRNTLKIVVVNTLANAICNPKVRQQWESNKSPGWPGAGLRYDAKNRPFEEAAVPSGLFGPVRVVFGHR